MFTKTILALFITLGLQGCTPLNFMSYKDYAVPASRVDITPEGQTELQRIIAKDLGASFIVIKRNAFIHKHTISVEKNKLLGFDLDKPTVFKLLKVRNNKCILINQKTTKKYLLEKTECIAI